MIRTSLPVVLRGAIVNTRLPADRDPTAMDAAMNQMNRFFSDASRSITHPSRRQNIPEYFVRRIN